MRGSGLGPWMCKTQAPDSHTASSRLVLLRWAGYAEANKNSFCGKPSSVPHSLQEVIVRTDSVMECK